MYLILQEKINEAIKEIKSEKYISEVLSTSKFCHHGSDIIHYFEENDLIEEYANSKNRKNIISKYIEDKLKNIKKELLEELKEGKLYRSILIEEIKNKKDDFGIFWSSNKNTSACIQNNNNLNEYLLETNVNINQIDFLETIKSRLDVIHGEREFEIQLYKGSIVELQSFKLVFEQKNIKKNKIKN